MFHGTQQKEQGKSEPPPELLVWWIRSYPMLKLVAGPWGDLSEDFHILLGIFAKGKAEAEARRGNGPSSGILGKCMGEIRRAIYIQMVRRPSLYLLKRIAQLGSGAKEAGDRRRAVQKQG